MPVAAARSRRRRALLWCALAACVLAGCGRDDQDRGGSVTLAFADSVDLDPLAPEDPLATALLALLHEGLVRFDTAGVVRPAHAREWDISDDGLRYTFTLGERRYEDGSEITTADYVRTLQAVFRRDPPSPARPRFWSLRGAIARRSSERESLAVRARDARTLEIRLSAPDPTLLEKLAHPRYAVPTAGGERERKAGHALASGAYKRVGGERGAWVLVRNPHYRGEAAGYLDTIRVRLNINARRAALGLVSGQLHLLWPVPTEYRARLLREPEVRHILESGSGAIYWALGLNCELAPTARLLVRQAAARSVNRQRILDQLGGRATTWRGFSPGVTEVPVRGLTMAPGFDPVAALADLEAADRGRGVTLNVAVPRGSLGSSVARAALADVGRSGIYAELKPMARAAAQRAWLERRNAIAFVRGSRPPTHDPLENLAEDMLNRSLDERWTGNLGFLRLDGGAGLDSLLLRALRAPGEEARERGREEVEARLAEELPFVPLARVRDECFYRSGLEGVRFHPFYGLDLAQIRWVGRN